MRRKLFWSLVGFTLVISMLLCVLLIGGMYVLFNQQLKDQLVLESDSIASLLDTQADKVAFLGSGVYINRVTLVDTDGAVLYDSQGDAAHMENHAGRSEIADALRSGTGWANRSSATLGETSVYYARKLSNGQILRVSGSQKTVTGTVQDMFWWVALGLFVSMVLASQLARPLTRTLVKPLNAIRLDDPLESDVYEELAPMLRRMDEQNRRIDLQMTSMQRQQTELNTILNGLREGLIVLDESHHVLAINPAARRILNAEDGEAVGKLLPELNRHETLLKLLRENGGSGEMHAAGRVYRVSGSVSGKRAGMVLLLQDVTDERMAELNRQQFSANVSHELRTPLTTISGYAELLATGLAKPEDTATLAGKIHQESKRMLTLIEDIIRLSRLDEGVVGEKQPIDLLLLVQSCASKLRDAADRMAVTVSVTGESATVLGDRTLLEEMVINLVDNAIKYNRRAGTVQIDVGMEGKRPRFSVKDTGVGISEEHQARVFERFYRVDMSRSKDTGGTGLGLSIVKHGAQLHHAALTLKSKPGAGTTITLLFPEQKELA
jgi:two-component system phosphate regulon sensor histidine kinase PhoR